MKETHFKILKRRRKTTKGYKWLKIYFTDKFEIEEYCFEIREELFLSNKKTEKFYIKTIKTRNDKDRLKTYTYVKWVEAIVSDLFISQFNKSYEAYIFNIRQNKLKRLI